ncbi:MAG TPA: PP2C family protein-serine/threonine phosphatase, partial [Bryobacteraceae bacterium]|nr:PP2C family protein-serine/threonine phosphatase [Bryobacteraceae bacterium]
QAPEALYHPAETLRAVNKLFYDSTPPEHFATLFFGYYDDRTRHLRYANCGHLPPLLVRADGSLERLEATATVLGVFKQWSSDERSVELRPGDAVVLYTDGVTEAGVVSGAEFGEDGLLSLVQRSRGESAGELVERIVSAVEGDRHDDVTAVVLRAR